MNHEWDLLYKDEWRSGHDICRLDISELNLLPTGSMFLEHTDDKLHFAATNAKDVFCLHDGRIEQLRCPELPGRVQRLKTLRNGYRLIQTELPTRTCLMSPDWRIVATKDDREHQWHGSWSVDQSTTGTIMFAEYSATREREPAPLHVWRSVDGGREWQSSLELLSSPRHPRAHIRHFHTCIADPGQTGRWYVSTGDITDNNRLYVSEDDGVTWQQIHVRSIAPSRLVAPAFRSNVLRFTCCWFDGPYMYWPTDDGLGLKRAALVRFDRTKPHDGHFEVIGFFDRNLMRNVLRREDHGDAIAISESKDDVEAIDLFHIASSGSIKRLAPLPNRGQATAGGAFSRSSKTFGRDGAFSIMDKVVLGKDRPSVVRYRLDTRSLSEREVKRLDTLTALRRRTSPLLVFFHAQRTAGTSFKKLLQDNFEIESLYYQRTVSDFKNWRDLTDNDLKGKHVYAAHDNFSQNTKITRDIFLFSIVRNPVERAISLYHYLKKRPEHKLYSIACDLELLPFYERAMEIAPGYVSNVQCTRVCGHPNAEMAVDTSRRHPGLIAPYDRLDEAVASLGRFFSRPLVENFNFTPNARSTSGSDLGDGISFLQSINDQDIVFYKAVCADFDSSLSILDCASKYE